MVLADVHLSDIIWSMLWLFFLFIWIMILVQVLIDLFRDHELSGVAKALVGDRAGLRAVHHRVRVHHRPRQSTWPSGA